MAKGRELPQWYLEEPELLRGDRFFLDAFKELNTCRTLGMEPGPIPWNHIIEYSRWWGLDEDLEELFLDVIRNMDNAYRDRLNKRSQENRISQGNRNDHRNVPNSRRA